MKILIVDRHFWPDHAPHPQMLYKIAIKLSDAGNEVSVLTTFPSFSWDRTVNVPYSEISHGINIRRLPLLPEFGRKILLRMINTVLFSMQIVFFLLFFKTDLVIACSNPPIIIAMIIRYISNIKGFKYIYHCQDIHPEAMLITGVIKNSFIYKILYHIDKININEAVATIVLSEDMKRTMINRMSNKANIQIINNFIFDSIQTESKTCTQGDKFTLLFAGNLGKFQGLEKILDVAIQLQHREDIYFLFLGEGIERKSLEQKAGILLNKTISFKGYRSIHETLTCMNEADIGIISIKQGMSKVSYPSKTMIYLSTGLPVFAISELDSCLSKFILSNNLGYVCDKITVDNLLNAIKTVEKNKNFLRIEKNRIKRIAFETFGEDVILNKWIKMISDIKC